MEATKTIRQELPKLLSAYSIESMLDIPCGDYTWMNIVEKKCSYLGGDIVRELVEINQKKYSNENTRFIQLDVTTDRLPKVDLIFCKDCLQHLSNENVKKALSNFKKSGSKYLLVTSYP